MATVVLGLMAAALPIKRKVTPAEWGAELEQHLLGTGGDYVWDDATSATIADPRLEAVRQRLWNFCSLCDDEKRAEFERIVQILKRGEIPDPDSIKQFSVEYPEL